MNVQYTCKTWTENSQPFWKKVRKLQGGDFFDSHCINYVAFLNMVRIVQGRYEQSKVRIVREPIA